MQLQLDKSRNIIRAHSKLLKVEDGGAEDEYYQILSPQPNNNNTNSDKMDILLIQDSGGENEDLK